MRKLILVLLCTGFVQIGFAQWQSLEGPLGDATTEFLSYNNKLYAATGNGVFRSSDLGNNWERAGMDLRGIPIGGLVQQNGDLYAYAWPGKRLFRSSDAGDHWDEITTQGLPAYKFHQFAATQTAQFISYPNLYRSTDGGAHWAALNFPGTLIYYYTRMIVEGNTIYVVAPFNGIYKSDDNGDTWTNMTATLPKLPEAGTVYHNEVVAAYYVVNGWKISRSADAGATWTQDNANFQWNIDHMAVIDQNLYALSGYSIWTSPLNGNSWSSLASQVNAPFTANTNVDIPQRVKLYGASSFLYASSYAGLYRSQNNGYNWVELTNGMVDTRVRDVAVVGNTVMAAAGTGLHRRLLAGGGWSTVSNGPLPETEVLNISAVNNKLYAGTQYRLWTSADLGNSWQNNAPTFVDYYTEVAANGVDMIAGSSQGVYISSDGGSVWNFSSDGMGYTDQDVFVYPFIHCILPLGDTLYAADVSRLYRSSDRGHSWTQIDSVNGAAKLYYINHQVVRVINTGAQRSTDGGNNWVDIDFSHPDPVNCMAVAGNRLFAGTKGGVLVSDDQGSTWYFYYAGFPAELSILDMKVNGNYLYAGTSGEGVWRLTTSLSDVRQPEHVVSVAISPNPMESAAVITLPESYQGDMRIRLFNESGQLVRDQIMAGPEVVLQRGNLTAGAYRVEINRNGEMLGFATLIVR